MGIALPPCVTAEHCGLRRRRRRAVHARAHALARATPLALLAMALLVLCGCFRAGRAVSVYKGCWEDRDGDANEHAMPNVQLVPLPKALRADARPAPTLYDDMTAPVVAAAPTSEHDGVGPVTAVACVRTCDSLGFPYAGVSNGDSCFCSRAEPRYRQIDDWRCDAACNGGAGGGEPCGGHGGGALSVYGNEQRASQHTRFDPRPLLCLLLHVGADDTPSDVLASVESVVSAIDCYVLSFAAEVDPALLQRVRQALVRVPGQLIEATVAPAAAGGVDNAELWNRLAVHARQLQLTLHADAARASARQHENDGGPDPLAPAPPTLDRPDGSQPSSGSVFGLYLVAGEQVHNSDRLRRALLELRASAGLAHSAYEVELYDRGPASGAPTQRSAAADDVAVRIIRFDQFGWSPAPAGAAGAAGAAAGAAGAAPSRRGSWWRGRVAPSYGHATAAPIDLYRIESPGIEIDRTPHSLRFAGPLVGGAAPGAGGGVSWGVILNAFGGSDERYHAVLSRVVVPALQADERDDAHDLPAVLNLARVYTALRRPKDARDAYDRLRQRSARHAWPNDYAYHALLMSATLVLQTTPPPPKDEPKGGVTVTVDPAWAAAQELLLEAYALRPHRMEAVHALAQRHFNDGHFHTAALWADRLVAPAAFAGAAADEAARTVASAIVTGLADTAVATGAPATAPAAGAAVGLGVALARDTGAAIVAAYSAAAIEDAANALGSNGGVTTGVVHAVSARSVARAQRLFYDRALAHLYDTEGLRLLGFASDRTQRWERCARALSAVVAARPDDTYAQQTLDRCRARWQEQRHASGHTALASGDDGAVGAGADDADRASPFRGFAGSMVWQWTASTLLGPVVVLCVAVGVFVWYRRTRSGGSRFKRSN